MTEYVNPFDSTNFRQGGGLWDDKVVTITRSKTEAKRLTRGDGSAVVDDAGNQIVKNFWVVSGIAEDMEAEITQEYSLGGLVPTPDGEGFTKADGTFSTLHGSTDAAKFSRLLKDGGFDVGLLFPNGKPKVSALEGARIRFKGEDRLDKNGKVIVNKKGFPVQDFYPVQFVGFSATAQKGNGVDDAFKAAASVLVKEELVAAGGSMTQVELVKALSKKMARDANLPAIVTLISKREVPGVKVEGATFSV